MIVPVFAALVLCVKKRIHSVPQITLSASGDRFLNPLLLGKRPSVAQGGRQAQAPRGPDIRGALRGASGLPAGHGTSG